jgi:serine/threonine-protein kinase
MSSPAGRLISDDAATFAALDSFLEDLHAGRPPDREKLLVQHPELAPALDCLEMLEELAPTSKSSPNSQAGEACDLNATLPQEPPLELTSVLQALPDLGEYELVDEIGRGGMGVVYLARQKTLDRLVAVKMILAGNLASTDQVERFVAEARTMARLHHPHIVGVHETGEIHGQHYLVMEYLSGPSLAQVLSRGAVSAEKAARYVSAVARAVDYLHTQGIVHRDLKPSNILLGEEDQPYVTDFGLVKMLQVGGNVTASGSILGTPAYMAPEQAAGQIGRVGPLSDVYSMGTILYELLTGQPPFREATALDTLVQVLEGEPPQPCKVNPSIPRDLELICLKCLEKAPEARYPSAAALADDLDHFLKAEAIDARHPSAVQRLRRWARREPALVARLAALAVCFVIVHLNYLWFANVSFTLHLQVLAVLAVWMLSSVVFQQGLKRDRWADVVPFAWSAVDLVLLTLLLILTDNWAGPLLVGYPLLVAASGLWFRARLVWFTTIVAEFAYMILLAFSPYGLISNEPHHRLIFLVALLVLGFVVAYQVRRIRALSRYYEHRRL